MAPIKFEEQLKEKLDKRTLAPSIEGWSKLSERLDADEKKSKNPLFWWLSIAAALIIMIAVSVQIFNTTAIEKSIPEIVEEQIKDKPLDIKQPVNSNSENTQVVLEEQAMPEEKNAPILNKSKLTDYKKVIKKRSETVAELNEPEISNPKKGNVHQKKEVLNPSKNLINDALIQETLASTLKELNSENASVTEREIDSLLKLASKELFKDDLQNANSKTVDASTLLMSVEDEMGQSFRSKVFEALKGSYETVKTAVAERNN